MSQHRIIATLTDRRDALWLCRAVGIEYGIYPEIDTVDHDHHMVVVSIRRGDEKHIAGFVRGFLSASGIPQTKEDHTAEH